MTLTSPLSLAIAIDSLGHATYYERLFLAMGFRATELTFSGLRRMWRKKEYGRFYQATKKVKQRRRIKQREKMIDGIKKMEKDAEDGMAYSSGIRLDDDGEENNGNCEEPARKKARRTTSNKNKCTSLTSRKKEEGCKCGGRDHQRIMSSKCPWQGLLQEVVCENYSGGLK
jgi:hypothetical protein